MTKRKTIVFVCTEDWFFHSHFVPLINAASSQKNVTIRIITNTGSAYKKLEQLGIEVIPMDFKRSSFNPFSAFFIFLRLSIIFLSQRPDLIHFIALKPILVGGLASLLLPKTSTVFHITGLGYLAEGKSRIIYLAKKIIFSLLAIFLKRRKSWLICENPDDLLFLSGFGVSTKGNVTILGGAGINPNTFPAQPFRAKKSLRIGYVGRMIWTKGVDILVEAMKLLEQRNIKLKLELYGTPDIGNPKSIQIETLQKWNKMDNITWHGQTNDVLSVWQYCDICVIATRTREGMPKSMLEAASCARALVVTDIPGCRHFVRNNVEGFIVPPENSTALADALEKLVNDSELLKRMGQAARQRLLEGYTINHVQEAVSQIYHKLLFQNKIK